MVTRGQIQVAHLSGLRSCLLMDQTVPQFGVNDNSNGSDATDDDLGEDVNESDVTIAEEGESMNPTDVGGSQR